MNRALLLAAPLPIALLFGGCDRFASGLDSAQLPSASSPARALPPFYFELPEGKSSVSATPELRLTVLAHPGPNARVLSAVSALVADVKLRRPPGCDTVPIDIAPRFEATSTSLEYTPPGVAVTPRAPLTAGWYELSTGAGFAKKVTTGFFPKPRGDGSFALRFHVGPRLRLTMLEFCPRHDFVSDRVELTFSEPAKLAPDVSLADAVRIADASGNFLHCTEVVTATNGISVVKGAAMHSWALDCGALPARASVFIGGIVGSSNMPLAPAFGASSDKVFDVATMPFADACRYWRPGPALDVRAEPSCLWPPNHQFVPFELGTSLKATLADSCASAARFRIVGITSSEASDALGDGTTSPDILSGGERFCLRAERSGKGMERTYDVTVEAQLATDEITQASVSVRVPHDQQGHNCPAIAPGGFVSEEDSRCSSPAQPSGAGGGFAGAGSRRLGCSSIGGHGLLLVSVLVILRRRRLAGCHRASGARVFAVLLSAACGKNPYRADAGSCEGGCSPAPQRYVGAWFEPKDLTSARRGDAGIDLVLLADKFQIGKLGAIDRAATDGMTLKRLSDCSSMGFETELWVAPDLDTEAPGGETVGSRLRVRPTQILDAGWYELHTGSVAHLLFTPGSMPVEPDGTYRTRIGIGQDLLLRTVEFCFAHDQVPDRVDLSFSEPAKLAPGLLVGDAIRATAIDGGVLPCKEVVLGTNGQSLQKGAAGQTWNLDCGRLPEGLTLLFQGVVSTTGQPLRTPDGGSFEHSYPSLKSLPAADGCFVGVTDVESIIGRCP
ncbi:MAG: hypothetical protein HYZ28_10285 [Myxococcales bacterium]|nr:hypothetical protein [Myxococcales bacterium]